MALVSMIELSKREGTKRSPKKSNPECKVMYAIHKGHKLSDGTQSRVICISIGAKWAEICGMKAGDRVTFLFDAAKGIGVIQPNADGWMLTKETPKSLRLQITWRSGAPVAESRVECGPVTQDGDSLKFGLPREVFKSGAQQMSVVR